MNEQLYDIYQPWHVPFWQTQAFTIVVVTLATVLAALFCLYSFKKFYSRRSLSPYDRAMADLQQLQNKKITTRQDAQAAYFSLTAILKTFFQARYNERFEGMSDYEMIANLRIMALPSPQIADLERIINESLSVKYARENALQDDVMRAVTTGIELIKNVGLNK